MLFSDDSTYDTVFQTKAGDALILRVHLPPAVAGASRAPAMTLVGVRVRHPWLDTRMRVIGYSPITSDHEWASSRILLGKAVGTVVQYLQLNPPEVIEITDPSLKRIQETIAQQSGQHKRQTSRPPHDNAPPDYESVMQVDSERNFHMPIPAVPSSFPELESMSLDEMRELLDDETKFTAYVSRMSAVTTLNDLRESIFKGNVETAETNLKHEEELDALHAEVSALRDTLKDKITKFRELEARQTELCTPPDKREVIRQLAKAKREAYDESEELASEWIDGGSTMDIDDFLEKFLERRTLHHTRAAKIERLNATM